MKFFRLFFPILAALLLVASLGPKDKPRNSPYSGRMMALEFARSQNDVDNLWEGREPLKKKLDNQLSGDTQYFIPAYWLFFVCINAFMFGNWRVQERHWLLKGIQAVTFLTSTGKRTFVRVIPFLVPLAISVAAIADLRENTFASFSLEHGSGAEHIFAAAVTKWAGIAVACFLAGLGFLDFQKKSWSLVAAAAYLATGIAMAIALIHRPQWMEFANLILLVSIGVTGPAIYAERSEPEADL